jgi:hypothetical protein
MLALALGENRARVGHNARVTTPGSDAANSLAMQCLDAPGTRPPAHVFAFHRRRVAVPDLQCTRHEAPLVDFAFVGDS